MQNAGETGQIDKSCSSICLGGYDQGIEDREHLVLVSQPGSRVENISDETEGDEVKEEDVIEPFTFYQPGDCVGLDVSNSKGFKDFKKLNHYVKGILPTIVFERVPKDDDFYYSLGVRNHTIKGWYPSVLLSRLSLEHHKRVFGIEENSITSEMITLWGYNAKTDSHAFVALAGAFYLLINAEIPPNTISYVAVPRKALPQRRANKKKKGSSLSQAKANQKRQRSPERNPSSIFLLPMIPKKSSLL